MATEPMVFVTVGTTQFDVLISTLLSPEALSLLASQGYRRLVLQVGRGAEPLLPRAPAVAVSWYRFKDSLLPDMRAAALIISHAGAGSIMEGLQGKARLLVVVNDRLMHNHQAELADELDRRGHLVAVTPGSVLEGLASVHARGSSLKPYPESDPELFPRFLASSLGVA